MRGETRAAVTDIGAVAIVLIVALYAVWVAVVALLVHDWVTAAVALGCFMLGRTLMAMLATSARDRS